ncbi:hypothetical protein KCTC32516_00039 [Polaribacter huanghezhanensis]|uniref:(4Fe-4S)-binding protein n=1 Tax=Polaribacter huanghezhanensis TaxID=1354726 RepID=UPI002648846E|nr:(4Fe-4S)-binding protein [Polaribacter huanghezhanensis]WKD84705.1 hypothetical protein KCTC32516_00039 [Polaribacter huanghezhanensis]
MEEKKQLKKTYSNEEITVVWQPEMCTHSKKCWKGLLEVFDPREKPWIKLDGATNEQVKNQINQCPSKALSYQLNNL